MSWVNSPKIKVKILGCRIRRNRFNPFASSHTTERCVNNWAQHYIILGVKHTVTRLDVIFRYPDRVPLTHFVHRAKKIFACGPEFSVEFSAPPEFSGGVTEQYLSTGWARTFDLQIRKQMFYHCATAPLCTINSGVSFIYIFLNKLQTPSTTQEIHVKLLSLLAMSKTKQKKVGSSSLLIRNLFFGILP